MTENTVMTSGEATESSEAETSWKEALPEDVREDPSMEAIQTVDNLAKSYVNAQKMIGADKIIVPNKYAEANEWQDVFTKLGLPESVDKYEISAKEEVDQEFFDKFKQTRGFPTEGKYAMTKAAKKPGFKSGVVTGAASAYAASKGAGMKKAKSKEPTKQLAGEAYKKQKEKQKKYYDKKTESKRK